MQPAGAYAISIDLIRREIFFNIESPGSYLRLFIGFVSVLAVIFLTRKIVEHARRWRQGTHELRTDYPEKRIALLLRNIFFQPRLLQEKYAGIMHSLIFFGATGLFLICLIFAFEQNLTGPVFGNFFIRGNFYLVLSLAGDICGLMIFIGLILAVFRRYISRPTRLSRTSGNTIMLIFLLFLVLTGFLTEGLRISASGFPEFERWSFIGWIFAQPFALINYRIISNIQQVMWFIHAAAGFTFVALMASGKLKHLVLSPLNIYFSNLQNTTSNTKYNLSLIDGEPANPGLGTTRNMTWKARLDCESCLGCGRCQDNCPAWLTEKPLSPKKLIETLRENIYAEKQNPEQVPSVGSDELWACTNCAACMEVCPLLIEHIPKILGIRRNKVLALNDIPYELRILFDKADETGKRQNILPNFWESSLTTYGVETMQNNADVDYLCFFGSSVRDDENARKSAEYFLSIMQTAGIKIGVLGNEEIDSGDTALRCGNEYLFRTLARKNIELFNKYGVKRLICTSPHDYNVFKKEYVGLVESGLVSGDEPLFYDVQIFHYTQIILDLIKSKNVFLQKPLEQTVVYHDSCFLGRYNNIYATPRSILEAVPGLRLVEMERSFERSFCCGSGGGTVFAQSGSEVSIKAFRAKEAQFSGADIICTACPFCKKMLTEGLADMNIKNIRIFDIAELVYNSMTGS